MQKLSKERFQAWDECNFRTQHNEDITEKLRKKLNDANHQNVLLQDDMKAMSTCNAATVYILETEMIQLRKENAELTASCLKLFGDLEASVARCVELESAREKSEQSALQLFGDLEVLDIEKSDLDERVNILAESEKKLTQQNMDAEANAKRLSDEVVFAHGEISRLTKEKSIMEEYKSQQQKSSDLLSELEEENKRKSKSHISLLEKEAEAEQVVSSCDK